MSAPRSKKQHTSSKANKKTSLGLQLRHIDPKTYAQRQVFEAFHQNHLLLHGFAGTGKSFCSLYLALREIFENQSPEFFRIIIVRSAVQTRDMGFMPGSLDEKMSYYETPYRDIVNNLFGRGDAYDILKSKGIIEFMSTSFVRGLTFDNAIVIVDELQNCTGHELDSVMTRIGEDTKVIFCGDGRQSDFSRASDKAGLGQFLRIIDRMSGIERVEFTVQDCVRSNFVRQYLIEKDAIEHDDVQTSKRG